MSKCREAYESFCEQFEIDQSMQNWCRWQAAWNAATQNAVEIAAAKVPQLQAENARLREELFVEKNRLIWLHSHCLALGLNDQSDSGKIEENIALSVIRLREELAAAQATIEQMREALKVITRRANCLDVLEIARTANEALALSIQCNQDALHEAQEKQEPVAWMYYPKGVGEKYVTYTNPASLDLGKQGDQIAFIQPLYAAPVVQPQQEPVGKPHRWNDDGERCLDCGDKDWMADKYCSAAPVVQEKQEPWPFSADRVTYHKAAPVMQPDPVLCNFYQVETFTDLVAAMEHHIEKLQAKVPPIGNNWPGKVREG